MLISTCMRNGAPGGFMKQTSWKNIGTVTRRNLMTVILLGVAWQARAQDTKASYPSMAPLEQYLMGDRTAEIALARSAAPPSIAQDADVMVLERHGYETVFKGKNGFVCMVE